MILFFDRHKNSLTRALSNSCGFFTFTHGSKVMTNEKEVKERKQASKMQRCRMCGKTIPGK